MLTQINDRRQSDRPLTDVKAWYRGENDHGFSRARAVNVSSDGVRLVMDHPPSENCYLVLQNSRGEFANVEATATWSQPLPGGHKFVAGLQFNGNNNVRRSFIKSGR